MSRRSFLRNTASGGLGLLILRNSASAATYQANEKLNVALVGVSGRGSWFVRVVPELRENVVAMCDANERRAAEAFAKFPQAKKYSDFRKMLDEMGKQIDAVTVATPDNTHAIITMTAMKAGKHVLCEKPLTHDVFEARALREALAKYPVATQMGNQGTGSPAFRQAVEIIQAGVLGEVHEVHAWNTGGGSGERPLPKGSQPVLDFLNWDVWLGPAADRPFHDDWLKWHQWRDFATGNLGNWASHTNNLAFKALRIDSLWKANAAKNPSERRIRLQADVSGIHKHTFPKWESIRYEIPARGDMPPVQVNWYNGGGNELEKKGIRRKIEEFLGRPMDWTTDDGDEWKDWAGILIVGKNGMLYANAHNTVFTLLPAERFKDFKQPEPSLPRSRGHEREWMDACKGGPAPMSNFSYSGPLTEFNMLGNVATQVEGAIEYDPVEMKITNNAQADKLLRRDYRQGWSL
jgi:hypothetical protein